MASSEEARCPDLLDGGGICLSGGGHGPRPARARAPTAAPPGFKGQGSYPELHVIIVVYRIFYVSLYIPSHQYILELCRNEQLMDHDLIASHLEKMKSCPPALDVSVPNLDVTPTSHWT